MKLPFVLIVNSRIEKDLKEALDKYLKEHEETIPNRKKRTAIYKR